MVTVPETPVWSRLLSCELGVVFGLLVADPHSGCEVRLFLKSSTRVESTSAVSQGPTDGKSHTVWRVTPRRPGGTRPGGDGCGPAGLYQRDSSGS